MDFYNGLIKGLEIALSVAHRMWYSPDDFAEVQAELKKSIEDLKKKQEETLSEMEALINK